MQSPFNDKLAYSYPCKPSQTCIDYEDYDPCESNEDITEKDLVVLLKEEAAKLEREKEKAQATEAAGVPKTTKPLSDADNKSKQASQINDADFKEVEVEEDTGAKRKNCKYIKNPFFTNRLKLSTSHLPLPPPGPPPQNLPLANDESDTKICPRKKKKCKKDEKTKRPSSKITDDNGERGVKDETGDKDGDGSTTSKKSCNNINVDGDDDGYGGYDDDDKNRKKKDAGKKRCKKRIDELLPPCKKRESEVSINFGPRKIPLQQKDLPQTSPKDIPEVEHQLLMACGQSQEDDCKKKCKKKDKA